ncbi:MAG: hypothetical protein HYR55_04090 [Acidobacteria bacterium]|nr:hypothetical protein [Acidobacteriota bacterium]MBI3658451.1 hypothetical protein [Acidobacteriota bacterium]
MNDKENPSRDDWLNFPALYRERSTMVAAECLALEALETYLLGKGPTTQNQSVESHLANCDRCSRELEYLKAFLADETAAGTPAEDLADIEKILRNQAQAFLKARQNETRPAVVVLMPQRPQKPIYATSWIQKLAVMAASVILIFAGIYYFRSQPPQLPSGTGPADSSQVRGRHVELLFPLGSLSGPPSELSWQPVAGAERYSAHITEVDGTPVWSETVATARVALPAQARDRLIEAKTYYWFVEARLGGGGIARSERGTFVVELSRKSPSPR